MCILLTWSSIQHYHLTPFTVKEMHDIAPSFKTLQYVTLILLMSFRRIPLFALYRNKKHRPVAVHHVKTSLQIFVCKNTIFCIIPEARCLHLYVTVSNKTVHFADKILGLHTECPKISKRFLLSLLYNSNSAKPFRMSLSGNKESWY